ncbi:L-2,4-diaminobutyrate decarboxylase [Thalassoglobus neptunius]|uniref:L-2,4-diaminobutyrate decarboxylase n=1 Tax=Thalassoglobus neptunius TaxID=1938619 RepID=A0A5C5VSN5_9PLAN|nr:aminotransferase class I/II-fold pyridoxal phosphate-dependent enzyme [Thalassoglobus neptunius]TWT41648.1 L-2,4-diaminobutyrate decarboxylase [Thalassoglobus neptunius]
MTSTKSLHLTEPMNPDAFTDAQQRIAAAYSPESLKSLGTDLVERLSQHMAELQQREHSVLNWNSPEENLPIARETLNSHAEHAKESLAERFQKLVDVAIRRGHNLHHPRYIGHQVPASIPIAGLFDAMGAITNQVMAIYEMGPWVTSVERALIERWGAEIGLTPGTFDGLVTHGGSLANLTALLTARNTVFPKSWQRGFTDGNASPVLVAHADSHYCVTRSAGMLGLGTENCLKAKLDPLRRIDPQALDEQLAQLRKDNRPILAVSAAACATPIGAFDQLNDIADVCRRHDVWMHVDAAHGGAVSMSKRHRHLISGLERSDSFICDAHKMMFVSALCAFVFYREKAYRYAAFQQDAPYLFDPSTPGMAEIDSGMSTVECTKRAAVYGLWGTWSLFGEQLFADLVDVTFEMTQILYRKLEAAEDFVPLHQPQANIQVFRYVPSASYGLNEAEVGELNRQIRWKLIESGKFYIVQTHLDGQAALRTTLMNPLTTEDDLNELLAEVRSSAATQLKEKE